MKISRLATALTLSMLTIATADAARYRIVELPVSQEGVNTFSTAMNEGGEVVTSVQTPFNPPIDVELLNFESDVLINGLTDASAASVGNINDDDLLFLFNFISNSASDSNPFVQQIANFQSFLVNGTDIEPLIAFDIIDSDVEGLTKSADTFARGINSASATVGASEAPYKKIDYRNDSGDTLTLHYQDFANRGFLDINGQVFDVLPDEDAVGGISEAYDINDSFEVTGFGTVEVLESFEDAAADCNDSRLRGDIPVETCTQNLRVNYLASVANASGTRIVPFDSTYKRRAMIWEYNRAGDLIRSRELGTLIDEVQAQDAFYGSIAKAINNNGIAVGVSHHFFQESESVIVDMAAVFDGDEVVGFIDDQTYFRSEALDINDNDIAVGYATRRINGVDRNQFFVYDHRGETTVFPDGFFDSSASIARAINNSGLVVGEAEIDTDIVGTRRQEAFLYDYFQDDFTNINDLLSCDSPYTVVQGNDINEDGEIAATAVIYREQSDVTGDLALDSQGNTVFGNVSVAVKLIPIPGGTIDNCQLIDTPIERQGGSLFWLIPLLAMSLLYRRKR